MRFPQTAILLALVAFPALAQSPTITPANPQTTELWAKPPFGAEPQSLRAALANSCAVFGKKSPSQNVSADLRFGTYGQWQKFCTGALGQPDAKLESYFAANLQPLTLAPEGKFTGYYKPVVEGSLTHHGDYQTPILARPDDLVKCNGVSGQKHADGTCTSPYPNRAQIEKNLDRYKVLLWLKDPIDAYFIHIQGSALVELEDGGTAYISFAAKNGWPYVAIGKVLKEKGELHGDITADKIRQWLAENPTRMNEILQQNPSYIFFHRASGAPLGAMGVPLVAGRSMAVDRSFIPLGLPLLVKTTTNHDSKPWERVMLAQDIGSAITGGARGDIFFGLGPYAGDYAGDQNSTGTLQVLVPKGIQLETSMVSDTTVSATTIGTNENMVTPTTILISQTSVSMNTVSATDTVASITPPSIPAAVPLESLNNIEPAAAPESTTEATAKQAVQMVKAFVSEHLQAPNPTDTNL